MKATEEQIQRTIVEGLTVLGYIVLQTTHRRKALSCPRCQTIFRPAGGYGASPGVPDLIVSRLDWPAGTWLALEVKGSSTRLSKEQKYLQAEARIVIVRSWEDALLTVKAFQASLS